jgi:hypothetical protein
VIAVRAYDDVVHAAADRDGRDSSFCWLPLVRIVPRLSHVIPIISDAVQHFHASPQIFGLITRSRKLGSPSMSGRQRSALSLVPDHNGRHCQKRAVRRDTGVVAALSSHTSQTGPIATTLAGACLPQHD